jgi:hypothetical protein
LRISRIAVASSRICPDLVSLTSLERPPGCRSLEAKPVKSPCLSRAGIVPKSPGSPCVRNRPMPVHARDDTSPFLRHPLPWLRLNCLIGPMPLGEMILNKAPHPADRPEPAPADEPPAFAADRDHLPFRVRAGKRARENHLALGAHAAADAKRGAATHAGAASVSARSSGAIGWAIMAMAPGGRARGAASLDFGPREGPGGGRASSSPTKPSGAPPR